MTFEHWLAFAATAAVMLALPGPTVLLVVSHALGHGRRAAGASVAGVALGDFTAMTASMLGLGALLATSAAIFAVLKWIGAAYLVWIGIALWRAPAGLDAAAAAAGAKPLRIFAHTYLVTALNPKSIVFFVAFLPQFLDMAQPLAAQMAIFETTFLALAVANAATYARLAGMARGMIGRPGVQRIVNRAGGSLLIASGVAAAGWNTAAA